MNDAATTPAGEPSNGVAAPVAAAAAPARAGASRAATIALVILAIVAISALVFAWRADQRVRSTERELVKRQQDNADRIAEALVLARQSQDGLREATAKVALLEARLNEVSVQRTQLEDLIQSVARSRDESLVADIEAAMRAAVQQSALTGSAEPLVTTLKQSDERLARANQPRLEPLRRAIARDLDKVKASSVADVATLSIRIDEVVRLVDELPLVASAETRREPGDDERLVAVPRDARGEPIAKSADPAASMPADPTLGDRVSNEFSRVGRFLADKVWSEVRSLVRITPIAHPEAMLVSPDQAFFLRENLKLRLLNARLALMARQFDSAQADLKWVQGAIDRYFVRTAKRTVAAAELLRQVTQQARSAGVARPDDTLAALATAGAR